MLQNTRRDRRVTDQSHQRHPHRTRDGATVFTVEGELANTFGALRQVLNPHPESVIDRLSIALTNSAAECCRNPMGIDTIVVVK